MEETQLNEAWRESEEWAWLKIVEQTAYKVQWHLEKHEMQQKNKYHKPGRRRSTK